MKRANVGNSMSVSLRGTALIAALVVLAAGCAVNPVTGQRELSLITTADEISIGEEQYQPLQQLGGGRYKVDPGVAEYVSTVGRRVAETSDRPLPYEFVVVNDGTPNAWALPGGKIGVHRGLLVELESEAELAAVLGHEIVHAAAKHSANRIQRQVLFGLAELGVALASKDSKHAPLIVGAAGVGLYLAGQKFSRDQERISDYHGIKYMHAAGYDTRAAVALQEKFVALAEQRRNNWLEGLFASHPPSPERVENNRLALTEYSPGGEVGSERYRERMAHLFSSREAYDLAEQARRNIQTNSHSALQYIDQAIEREPREALFHGIKGDILASLGRHPDAVAAYDAAIGRDPDYYGHYLGRGLSRESLNENVLSRSDISRSHQLLPTAVSAYKLGAYALSDGRRTEAKRLFEAASGDGGDIGRAAMIAFLELDIVDAPFRYVTVEPFLEDGQVAVAVTNKSNHDVSNVLIQVNVSINGESGYRKLSIEHLAARATVVRQSGVQYREEDEVRAGSRVIAASSGW